MVCMHCKCHQECVINNNYYHKFAVFANSSILQKTTQPTSQKDKISLENILRTKRTTRFTFSTAFFASAEEPREYLQYQISRNPAAKGYRRRDFMMLTIVWSFRGSV